MLLIDIAVMVINSALIVLLAPLVDGIIKTFVARFQSRIGSPVTQTYRDLLKLLSKQSETVPDTPFPQLYHAVPLVLFATAILVASLVPTFLNKPLGVADIIVIFYVLAIARFVTSIGAFNTVNPYAVLGAERENFIALMIEPTAILSFSIIALITGSTMVPHIIGSIFPDGIVAHPALYMAILAVVSVLVVEMCVVPFDLAEAEQEIYEGLMAEYSGKKFALMKWFVLVKRMIMLTLVVNLLIPFGVATNLNPSALLLGILSYLAKIFVAGVVLALIAAGNARFKIFTLARTLQLSFGLSILALAVYVLGGM
jgi:formate hydrogenlyase subunit 4